MNNREYINFIAKCEEAFDVSKLQYRGMHTWPIIRCALNNMFVKSGYDALNNIKGSLLNRIKHIYNALKDIKSIQNIFAKYDIVFFGNGITKSFFQDKWYDYIQEPIIEAHEVEGNRCLFIESGLYLKTPRNRKSFFSRTLDEVATLIAIALSQCITVNANLAKIELVAGAQIDAKYISRYILHVYVLAKIYSIILKITRPKKVYITCYYSITGLAMVYACNINRIESIDVQHGNIYNNFAYLSWNHVPEDGYNTLPSSYYLWTQADADLFLQNNGKGFLSKHASKVYGMPWAKFWMGNSETVAGYTNMLDKIAGGRRLKVLVTLRHDIFGDNDWAKLISVIENTQQNVMWFIRKHPTMQLEVGESLKEICSLKYPNVNYTESSTFPLFSLLRSVDMHITTASAVGIEALAFGVQTIYISNRAVEEMPHIATSYGNKVIASSDDILSDLLNRKPK